MVITQHFKGSQIALKRKTDFYILLYFLPLLILDFLLFITILSFFQPAEFDDTIHESTQQQQQPQQLWPPGVDVCFACGCCCCCRSPVKWGGDFSGEGEFFLTCSPKLTRSLTQTFFFFMRY